MDKIIDFIIEIIKDSFIGIKGLLKSQIIIMGITFVILSIGLSIIQVKYSIIIALGIALIDIIPVVGSGIIMIPWSIISFIIGNSNLGLGLAIIYVSLTVLRQIIEPIIMGNQIGVRPLYTFGATILGSIIFGPIGIIIGPFIAIIISSIYKTKKRWDEREK